MNITAVATLTFVVFVALIVAFLTRPRGNSTVDFYLAGRRVGVLTNSWAICGDYISAASFLGVAAAVYLFGIDGAWYAVGFAAGFIPVLLLIAAPLRRFGEFSLADFLGRRLHSEGVRLTAAGMVQLIILGYLIPQSVGGGITWQLLVGHGLFGLSPYVTGVLVSLLVISIVVAFGGMRGATWYQAVQFIVVLMALIWLASLAVINGFDYGAAVQDLSDEPLTSPTHTSDGWELRTHPDRIDTGRDAVFGEPGAQYTQLGQIALVVTLGLGTAGLPHVMNRYFTAPSGRAARTTTVWVLGLIGAFYALAVMMGTAARHVVPEAVTEHRWLDALTLDGVLITPEHALPALGRIYGGELGLGIISAAALIAVMSTVAGLLLAAAATWGHDVYERHINPHATPRQAVWAGRLITLIVAGLAGVAAVVLSPGELGPATPALVTTMVTWAFAVAGCALTPVLLLAIWWRPMTATGAITGMLLGAAVAVTALITSETLPDSPLRDLLSAPTLLGAPLAALAAALASRLSQPPPDVEAAWVTMHGTAGDRRAERLARLIAAAPTPRAGTDIAGRRTRTHTQLRGRRR